MPFDLTCVPPGRDVIKLEYSLKLKIKRKNWLLSDLIESSQSLRLFLSLRVYSSFITSRPGSYQVCVCLMHYKSAMRADNS